MNFAVLIIIINLLFFAAVAFYYSNLKKQMQEEAKLNLEERKLHGEEMIYADEKLKEELAEVKKRANVILSESEKIAQELIYELESTLGKKSSRSALSLPGNENFEIELGNLSTKIKSQYINRIHSLLRSLERFEIQEAHKVEAFAEEQAVVTDKNLQILRVDELKKMHERIERYKEGEMALFDKKVREVIDLAAMDVLGHALTNQEQTELISKALEKARGENKL